MCVCVCVCVYVCMYVCVYVYIFLYISVRVCVYDIKLTLRVVEKETLSIVPVLVLRQYLPNTAQKQCQ